MFRELFQLALANSEPQGWPTYDGLELDRTEFLTSSETAQCLRKAFFSKNSHKYHPKLGAGSGSNGFAERGHAIEAWLVTKLRPLRRMGYTFAFMGKDQRSFYDADLGISGTPDGLITTPDGKMWLLEIKSIDPRYNKNNLPKKGHVNQTQQNMFLVQQCLKIKLEGAILVYIDASNVYDIREFTMVYDEEMVQEGLNRSNILWNANEPDDLEPEGVYNGDCEYCAFTHHCSQVVNMQKTLERLGSVAAPFLEGETEGLNASEVMWVEQYVQAWEGLKQYGNEKEEVEGEVKRVLMEHNGLMQVGGYKLVGTMQAGRETIDKKLMEADGLDLTKYTKTGAPFVVLKITPPEE
jgi:hypothetical protein